MFRTVCAFIVVIIILVYVFPYIAGERTIKDDLSGVAAFTEGVTKGEQGDSQPRVERRVDTVIQVIEYPVYIETAPVKTAKERFQEQKDSVILAQKLQRLIATQEAETQLHKVEMEGWLRGMTDTNAPETKKVKKGWFR